MRTAFASIFVLLATLIVSLIIFTNGFFTVFSFEETTTLVGSLVLPDSSVAVTITFVPASNLGTLTVKLPFYQLSHGIDSRLVM